MSDNFRFDIVDEGQAILKLASQIAFSKHKATHWLVEEADDNPDWPTSEKLAKIPRLVLFWSGYSGAAPLPFPLDINSGPDFLWNWLSTVEYPPQPDHDGSNGEGWRLFNERWNRIGNHTYSFLALEPRWMLYGK